MSLRPLELLSPHIFAEERNTMLILQELLKAQHACLFITRNKKMILSLWCLIENNEGVNRKVGLGKSQVSCNCLGIKWEVRQSLLQLLGKRKHRITISDSLEREAEILQSLFFLIPSTKCTNCLLKYFDKKLKSTGFCPYEEWGCMPIYHLTQLFIVALWQKFLSCCLSLSLYLSSSLRNQNIIWHIC